VTVKNQDGKEVFSNKKEYAVYDLHFAENKEGYIGLNDWDITAMDHVDLGIKPKETDSQTFVIPLSEDTKSVNIEAAFSYIYEEGNTATIHTVTEKVDFKE
jgi:hypothetical protein